MPSAARGREQGRGGRGHVDRARVAGALDDAHPGLPGRRGGEVVGEQVGLQRRAAPERRERVGGTVGQVGRHPQRRGAGRRRAVGPHREGVGAGRQRHVLRHLAEAQLGQHQRLRAVEARGVHVHRRRVGREVGHPDGAAHRLGGRRPCGDGGRAGDRGAGRGGQAEGGDHRGGAPAGGGAGHVGAPGIRRSGRRRGGRLGRRRPRRPRRSWAGTSRPGGRGRT